jgi:hypothetical protein
MMLQVCCHVYVRTDAFSSLSVEMSCRALIYPVSALVCLAKLAHLMA